MMNSHPKARVLAALCCLLALLALPAGASEPVVPSALSVLPENTPDLLRQGSNNDLLSPAMAILAAGLRFDKSGLADRGIRFTAADFDTAAGMKAVNSITLLTLPDPTVGCLCLNGTPVKSGQIVSRADLEELQLLPESGAPAECSFTFGLVGSGPCVMTCALHLLPALNAAPTGAAEDFRTYENVSCFGSLSGEDPEGDPVRYEIVSYPHAGILLSDEESGSFRYIPAAGYLGSDRFTYVCIDSFGSRSDPQEVKVRVEKNKSGVFYADIADHPAGNAAVCLAEEGLTVGTTLADKCYFEPEATLSRSEFYTLLLRCPGASEQALTAAGLALPAEGDKAPVSREEAAAALDAIAGNAPEEGARGVLLLPEEGADAPLTRAEAALSLCRLLQLPG